MPTDTVKLSQKEYLKRYLSGGSDDKKKKKKAKKSKGSVVGSQAKVKVIDDDVDLSKLQALDDSALDLYETNEDAPQIAGIVDERPAELQVLDQYKQSQRWKVLSNPDGDGVSISAARQSNQNENVSISSDVEEELSIRPTSQSSKEKRLSKSSTAQTSSKSGKYASDDSDASPPRKRRDDSDASPPRLKHSEKSPQRRKASNYDSDVSPPRKGRQNDSDVSPPRKRYQDDSDISPPRKSHQDDSDASPPRKGRNVDSDTSPPRKRRQNDSAVSPRRKRYSDHNISPPRKRLQDNSDGSPHRRRGRIESDVSPPRRRRRRQDDSDESPPRKRDVSPIRRKNNHKPSEERKVKIKVEKQDDTSNETKMKKTLDGKAAGLQDAKKLKQELLEHKLRENRMFEMMDESLSGKGATAVQRDRKTGLKRDLEREQAEQRAKDEKDGKKKEKYTRWGKGLKQTEDQQERLQRDLYEMSKPLARYADDADLDSYLKDQEREGDPMAEYIKSKKKEDSKSKVPIYQGAFPPNRYNIRPGYRWDGVDRSNGYEKKRFEAMNAKKAVEEEAYKWSTSDM